MFSETALGDLLRDIQSGSYQELKKQELALTLIVLLLADISIFHDKLSLNELNHILSFIYGDQAVWRYHEKPPKNNIFSILEKY